MKERQFGFRKHRVGYTIFILSYLSFTVFSSYPSVLAVELPISTMFVFVVLQAAALCYFANRAKLLIPIAPAVIFILRLILFVGNAIALHMSLRTLFYEIALTLIYIYLFSFMYSYASDDGTEIRRLLIGLTTITTLQLAVGILIHGSNKGEIAAGIGMSNYAATFLLLASGYFLFSPKTKYSVLWIGISVCGVLFTLSFGAYVVLAILVALRLFTALDWKLPRSWLILLGLVVAGVLTIIVLAQTDFGKPMVDKMAEKLRLLFTGNLQAFGSSRLMLYEFTLDNIKRHWALGPIENFNPNLVPSDAFYRFQYDRSHNLLLESLVQYGVFGTLVNLALVIYVCRLAKRRIGGQPAKKAIVIAILGTVAHWLIEPNFFTMHFEILLWILLGALLSPNKWQRPKLYE